LPARDRFDQRRLQFQPIDVQRLLHRESLMDYQFLEPPSQTQSSGPVIYGALRWE
jgi:hypothetical protein